MVDHKAAVTAVQRLWRRLGSPPRVRDWEAWSEQPDRIATIYRRFGGWTALVEEADRLDLRKGMPRCPPGTPSRSRALRALMARESPTLSPLVRDIQRLAREG